MSSIAEMFPAHAAGMILEHNPHHSVYESVDEYFGDTPLLDRVSKEIRDECVRSDSIWTLQWYPSTPVGFNFVAAATLERVLKLAREISEGENG